MRYENCRRCGAQIQIARSARRGVPFALEAAPDEGYGNVLVDGFGRAHVFRDPAAVARVREEHPDSDLAMSESYVPHAARCAARKGAEARQPELVSLL